MDYLATYEKSNDYINCIMYTVQESYKVNNVRHIGAVNVGHIGDAVCCVGDKRR